MLKTSLELEVLEIVKHKTRLLSIDEASLIYSIKEVEEAILNYTNQNTVPDGLKYTWANMSTDLAKYDYHINTEVDDSEVSASDVSSIKMGDATISLEGGNNSKTAERDKASNKHNGNLDGIVMNYVDSLNKYRRMVW